MSVKVKKSELQEKYNYIWDRDKGDGEYTGILDIERIDKNEGYEVAYFIQTFLNTFNLNGTLENIRAIEDELHRPKYSDVVMRDELIRLLKLAFSL